MIQLYWSGLILNNFSYLGIDRFVMAWRPDMPPSTLEVQELQRVSTKYLNYIKYR